MNDQKKRLLRLAIAALTTAAFGLACKGPGVGPPVEPSVENLPDGGIDRCALVTCNQPPGPSCSTPMTVSLPQPEGSCDPATGACAYAAIDLACPTGCADGTCPADPCFATSCLTPPAPTCVAGARLRIYSQTGLCASGTGACEYASVDVACLNACTDGVCVGEDLCAGKTCATPPAPVCAGPTTLRTFADTGTCNPGTSQCTYAGTDSACPGGCSNGVCKTAVDGGYEDLCSTFVTTRCNYRVDVCKSVAPAARAACVNDDIRALCNRGSSVAVGALALDAGAFQECMSKAVFDARACSIDSPFVGCNSFSFLEPNAAPGGRCLANSECPKTQACFGTGCGRTCQDAGTVGLPCAFNTSPLCANGYCIAAIPNSVCRPYKAIGEECGNYEQCDPSISRCGLNASNINVCLAHPGEGERCAGADCQPGLWCSFHDNIGECRRPLNVGEACASGIDACASSLYCNVQVNPPVCQVAPVVGQACDAFTPCVPPNFCNNGTCSVPRTEGQSCNPTKAECASPLECDSVLWTCQTFRKVVAGEQCTDSKLICPVVDLLCRGLVSSTTGPGTPGTCGPRLIGDPCVNWVGCPSRAYCNNGTCAAGALGTPCEVGRECPSGHYCTGTECAALLSEGSACNPGQLCVRPSYCRQTDGGTGPGTCLPRAGLGSPCTSAIKDDCQFPYLCRGGKCNGDAGHVGEPCLPGALCLESRCAGDGGTCSPLSPPAGPCVTSRDCEVGFCLSGQCQTTCL